MSVTNPCTSLMSLAFISSRQACGMGRDLRILLHEPGRSIVPQKVRRKFKWSSTSGRDVSRIFSTRAMFPVIGWHMSTNFSHAIVNEGLPRFVYPLDPKQGDLGVGVWTKAMPRVAPTSELSVSLEEPLLSWQQQTSPSILFVPPLRCKTKKLTKKRLRNVLHDVKPPQIGVSRLSTS